MNPRTNKLAPTVVITKPDDALAAIDVYSGLPSTPVNDIRSLLPSEFTDGLNSVTNFLNNSTIKNLDNITNSIKRITESDVTKTLSNLLVGGNPLEKMGDNLKNYLKDNFNVSNLTDTEFMGRLGIPSEVTLGISNVVNSPGVKFIIDGQSFVRQIEDMDSLKDLQGIMSGLTGNEDIFQFLDIEGEHSLIRAVMDFSDSLGLKSAADKLLTRYTDPEKVEYYVTSLNTFVKSSNLSRVEETVNMSGGKRLTASYPNVIIDLLRYTYSSNLQNIGKSDIDRLMSILHSIDPNWNKVLRNGLYIQSTEIYSNINKNLREGMLKYSNVSDYLMISDIYKKSDFNKLVKETYPLSGLT